MQTYLNLLNEVMEQGTDQLNERTGIVCRYLVGRQLAFDMRDGFPAVTTKKLPFKSGVAELLGFFRGHQSAAQFRELGCGFWDQNANETKAWLENPYRKGREDFLGRIYGAQWTDWTARRVATSDDEVQRLINEGFRVRLHDPVRNETLLERSINQLEDAARTIMTNPTDRRIIVSAWRPDEFDLMALPPCHMDYRFTPNVEQRTLDVVMTMRSADLFLGVPVNIATTSVFLAVMARLTGYTPARVVVQMTNVHLYGNHFDQVREQLARTPHTPPRLALSGAIRALSSVDEVSGAFTRIEPQDIALDGYQCEAPIKAPMAA